MVQVFKRVLVDAISYSIKLLESFAQINDVVNRKKKGKIKLRNILFFDNQFRGISSGSSCF